MIEYLGHNFFNTRETCYTCITCNIKVRGYFENIIIYLDIDLYGKRLILTCQEQQIKNLIE